MPRGQTYRDVHVNRPLSNYSVALWQDTSKFVSPRFFNTVPVNNASDIYTTYPQGYFNRIYDTKRDEQGVANSIQYKTKDYTYSVDDDALRIFISDKKRANADSHRNLDLEGTKVVMDALMLGRELDFKNKFLTASKWTTDIDGVAASPSTGEVLSWLDASADPVQNVLDQIVAMTVVSGGHKPNKGLMTLDVYMVVREHPSVLDRIKYDQGNEDPAQANLRTLAKLFELDEIVIMETVQNTGADTVEDATTGLPTVSNAFMASQLFFMAYVAPGSGLLTATAASTFAWNQYLAMGMDSGPAVRRYRPQDGRKGEFIEAELAIDQKLVAPDLGVLFLTLLATA